MNRNKTLSLPAGFVNERLLGCFFSICALFLLFRPPATWSEIFFLASLKKKPVTIAHNGPEFNLLLPDDNLILHKSPYLPEWTVSIFESLSRVAANLVPDAAQSLTGGSDLMASRVIALLPAICAALLFRNRRKEHQHCTETQNSGVFLSERTANFILILSLPVFVRWGAIEQLCVLLALTALTALPPVKSKLRADHRSEFQFALLFAFALSAACSRTWSYSLLSAAALWLCLKPAKIHRLKRIIFFTAGSVSMFGLLFLIPSGLESFVSHLTQRWLYLNEPRYLPDQWLADGLLWKTVAGFIAALSLRKLIASAASKNLQSSPLFAHLLPFCAALHICFIQTVPVAADTLLLILICIHSLRSPPFTEAPDGRFARLCVRFAAALPVFYLTAVAGAAAIAVILILIPVTRVVPDLQAAAEGLLTVARQSEVLTTTLLVLTAATLIFFVLTRRQAGKTDKENEVRNQIPITFGFANLCLLSAAAALLSATELRSVFIWDELRRTLDARPEGAQIFYLPKMEPLIRILPQRPHHMRMATVFEGGAFLFNERRSVLLIPTGVSEVCHAAEWNVEVKNGIFALCDTGQGTILHLLPLN
jgi:hypothetical protein